MELIFLAKWVAGSQVARSQRRQGLISNAKMIFMPLNRSFSATSKTVKPTAANCVWGRHSQTGKGSVLYVR
jgi:hypothetical protein